QLQVGLAGRTDRQPPEVVELGDGDVLAHLEAELVGVERERLVLVAHPDVDVGDGGLHGVLLWGGCSPQATSRRAPRLLQSCSPSRAAVRGRACDRRQAGWPPSGCRSGCGPSARPAGSCRGRRWEWI